MYPDQLVLKHDIVVAGAKPIKQNCYRVNPVKGALMKSETEYMLKCGFARPSSSPCSSFTIIDSYLLLHVEDCVATMGMPNL